MWPFKKKLRVKDLVKIRDFLEANQTEGDILFFPDGSIKKLSKAESELFAWWDDMKPDWDYLKKNNPPLICPYVPTSWYVQCDNACFGYWDYTRPNHTYTWNPRMSTFRITNA